MITILNKLSVDPFARLGFAFAIRRFRKTKNGSQSRLDLKPAEEHFFAMNFCQKQYAGEWLFSAPLLWTIVLFGIMFVPCQGADLKLGEIFPDSPKYLAREMIGKQEIIKLPDGGQAVTAVFRKTRWQLKAGVQSATLYLQMEAEAMKLPEAERRQKMDRIDDYTQVWGLPLAQFPQAGAEVKKQLKATDLPHQSYREVAFLGRSKGQAWYAFMPIYEWIVLQERLNCTGGDDPLAAAIRGMRIKDSGWPEATANSVQSTLVNAGAKSLPYLKPLLESTNYWGAISVVDNIQDPAAETLLIDMAKSSLPAAKGARRRLESKYREAAVPLYLGWLEQDAGRGEVYPMLKRLEEKHADQLRPFLPRIMASPSSFGEYRLAFELTRKMNGRPIPEQLLKIERDIQTHGYKGGKEFDQVKVGVLAQELGRAADTDAAGVIAITLALSTTKGDSSLVHQAGLAVLNQIPKNHGKKLLEQLLTTCRDPNFKRKIESVQ